MPRERSRSRRAEDAGAADGGSARGRALWSGVISFGLVAVPVELFAGSRRSTLSLRMLAPDGTPLARRYVCPEDGKVLSGDQIERGYEVSEGEFVVVSDEELEQLSPRRSREIALERFVPRAVDGRHPATPQRTDDPIGPELRPGRKLQRGLPKEPAA